MDNNSRFVFWSYSLCCWDLCGECYSLTKFKNSKLFYFYDNDIFLNKHPLKSNIAHIILSKEEQEFLKSLKNE